MKNKFRKLWLSILSALFVMSAMGISAFALDIPVRNPADETAYMIALTLFIIAFVVEIIDIIVLLPLKNALYSVALPMALIPYATVLGVIKAVKIFAVVDVLLLIYIIYLLALISKAFQKEDEPEPQLKPKPAPKPEPKPEPKPKPKPKPVPIPITEHIEHVTVEEANKMMTDEVAISNEVFETDIEPESEYHEHYTGTKKAEINIDTICDNFEAGTVVSLNTLKAKGLVSKNAGFVKVLARGMLDKPFTVIAQDYSVAAVKMILLTGGKVIVADPSPEIAENK